MTVTPRERAAVRWIRGGPGGEELTPQATHAGEGASPVSLRRPSKVLAPAALTRAPEVGEPGPTRATSARSSSSAAAPSRTGDTAAAEPRALCAWCEAAELELAPGSHGICLSCRVRALLFGALHGASDTFAVVAAFVAFGLGYAALRLVLA